MVKVSLVDRAVVAVFVGSVVVPVGFVGVSGARLFVWGLRLLGVVVVLRGWVFVGNRCKVRWFESLFRCLCSSGRLVAALSVVTLSMLRGNVTWLLGVSV